MVGELKILPPQNMKTKICSKCKKDLPIKNFSKGNGQDGLFYWCKKCHHDYEIISKVRIKKVARIRYLKNKEEINLKCLKYYYENKNQLLKAMKLYRDTHKVERKRYLKNNKKVIRKYVNNKRKTDINFRLSDCLRHRIWKALKGISKSKRTLQLLGCSLELLKQYIESQFKPGMNWNNYGYWGWHIDHIKPCAKFDLSKPSEQKKCFHYTNLQPLWAADNIRKQDK